MNSKETELIKYSKTSHLPFSLGLQNDDRKLEDEHCFDEKTIAVTVKMDGENTSCYRDAIHARSLYAMTHYSQHYMKGLWATFRHLIPKGWRVCGENMYAQHSIRYENLESFFYVFNVWDENNNCLSYHDTRKFCDDLNLTHVLTYSIFKYNAEQVERLYNFIIQRGEEGIVIRNIESFHYNDFQKNIAKAVRKNHVQTDIHWTKSWIPNKLKETK